VKKNVEDNGISVIGLVEGTKFQSEKGMGVWKEILLQSAKIRIALKNSASQGSSQGRYCPREYRAD